MLSDEEKKAIESLIEIREFANLSSYKDTKISQLNAIDVVLNLIEKQSKEIEELKEKNSTLKNLQNDTNRLYIEMIERKNYFERELQKLEDKIKAKIEELDYNDIGNFERRCKQEVLQSLLEKE